MNDQHSDLARAQMDAEISVLERHLRSRPDGDDFLASLMRTQAEDRLAAVSAERAGLDDDALDLAFSEQGSNARHSMSTSVLANLLGRLQKALTFAGWARMAGPGVAGDPPSLVVRAFETEVRAFTAGSFQVELGPYESALEHGALEGAFDDFLRLAEAGLRADGPRADDDVLELAQMLGSEATRRFALFFAKVHEAQLEARFERRADPEHAVVLHPAQALQISQWLGDVEEQFETVPVAGRLTAADVNGGRFAITDEMGEIHEGRAAPELLSHAVIDGAYFATMRVTTSTSVVTGVERKRAVLEALTRQDD